MEASHTTVLESQLRRVGRAAKTFTNLNVRLESHLAPARARYPSGDRPFREENIMSGRNVKRLSHILGGVCILAFVTAASGQKYKSVPSEVAVEGQTTAERLADMATLHGIVTCASRSVR